MLGQSESSPRILWWWGRGHLLWTHRYGTACGQLIYRGETMGNIHNIEQLKWHRPTTVKIGHWTKTVTLSPAEFQLKKPTYGRRECGLDTGRWSLGRGIKYLVRKEAHEVCGTLWVHFLLSHPALFFSIFYTFNWHAYLKLWRHFWKITTFG